jgi:hypothetical protein
VFVIEELSHRLGQDAIELSVTAGVDYAAAHAKGLDEVVSVMGRQRRDRHGVTNPPNGFSVLAAVMPPLWAVRYRLYHSCGCMGDQHPINVLMLLVNAVPQTLADAMWLPAILLVSGTTGTLAPRWHAYVLRRAGYVVAAEERE